MKTPDISPIQEPLAPLVESPTSAYVVGVGIGIACAVVVLFLLGALIL
jgi:hypothetical protein